MYTMFTLLTIYTQNYILIIGDKKWKQKLSESVYLIMKD